MKEGIFRGGYSMKKIIIFVLFGILISCALKPVPKKTVNESVPAANPYLGIIVGPLSSLDEVEKSVIGNVPEKGIVIEGIMVTEPPLYQGLLPLEIIQSVDGTPVESPEAFNKLVEEKWPGDSLKLDLFSFGEMKKASIKIADKDKVVETTPHVFFAQSEHYLKFLSEWILKEAKQNEKIAVLDFYKLDGTVTKFGKYFCDSLITELVKKGQGCVSTMTRSSLNSVIDNLNLKISSIFHPDSLKQLNEMAGVDKIVTASTVFSPVKLRPWYGGEVEFNVRILEVKTGNILRAHRYKVNLRTDEFAMTISK